MLRIRLTRIGTKKKPIYRIVVAERSRARNGSFVETLGHYNPRKEPPEIKVDLERIDYWLSKGAKPSETVYHLLRRVRTQPQQAEGSA